MKDDRENNPQFYQEEDYNFPYHHLPQLNNGFWSFGISWFHSLDYLTLLEFILSKIKEKNANKILDFGCGDGRLVKELIVKGENKSYGVDISKKALTFAKLFSKDEKNKIFFHDLKSLNQSDFDFVIATEVLEHIHENELPNALKDIFEIMNNEGYFLVTVPSVVRHPIPKKHYRHYTLKLLNEHVSDFFNIEEVFYLNKKSFLTNIIRRFLHNKIFTLNSSYINKILTKLYRKYLFYGNEKNGQNIALLLRKKI